MTPAGTCVSYQSPAGGTTGLPAGSTAKVVRFDHGGRRNFTVVGRFTANFAVTLSAIGKSPVSVTSASAKPAVNGA